jgi:hypothetical protein
MGEEISGREIQERNGNITSLVGYNMEMGSLVCWEENLILQARILSISFSPPLFITHLCMLFQPCS